LEVFFWNEILFFQRKGFMDSARFELATPSVLGKCSTVEPEAL
jgi:hypothetical protein